MTHVRRASYTAGQASFYLGYYVHLLTDKLWASDMVYPLRQKDLTAYERNRDEWFRVMKREWRALDLMYLKRHPDFRAFVIYERAAGFRNTYMSFFAEGAFDNRRAYITESYRQGAETAEADAVFLSEEEISLFVRNAADRIEDMISNGEGCHRMQSSR